jgi:hypothetical protein
MNRLLRPLASLRRPGLADNWCSDADSRIERIRKNDFVIELRARDGAATPAPGERPQWLLSSPLTPASFLATLDRLHAETGLPIHLTEISANTPDAARRADVLEMLFRLGFSHQAGQAILLWGFGATTHWMGPEAALMNADGTLTPAGHRISRLLCEVWTACGSALTGADGRLGFRGFCGSYALSIAAPDGRTTVREVHLSESVPTATLRTAD